MKTKIFALLAVLMVIVGGFSSCNQMDDALMDMKDDQNNITSDLRSTASMSNGVSILYMVDLSSYAHLQQPSIPGVRLTCGQTSYLVARRIVDSSFEAPTIQNVKNLHSILCDNFSQSYAITKKPKVQHLEWFAREIDKFSTEIFQVEERPLKGAGSTATINYNGAGRQRFKAFLERKLSEGKLIIVPTTFSFSPGSLGHFRIVVGMRDNNGVLEIGYKDVYTSSSKTHWTSYTRFLDANWYNQAEWKTVSSGKYYTSTYIGYTLQ